VYVCMYERVVVCGRVGVHVLPSLPQLYRIESNRIESASESRSSRV
jgi:hypothetical protein